MHFDASTDMAARGQHWDKFKAKMKDLCQAKKGKKDLGKSSKELDTIAVQHLSAEKSLAKPSSTRVRVVRRFRRTLHKQHQKSMHEALRYVGNHVMRSTRRGAGTLVFLSKTVTQLESNPRAIHRG